MFKIVSKPTSYPDVAPLPKRRRSRSFRRAEVLRAMDAVRAGGLLVASVELRPDGTITLSATGPAPQDASSDAFAQWESRL